MWASAVHAIGLVLVALVLLACVRPPSASTAVKPGAQGQASDAAAQAFPTNVDQLYEAARQEGKVVLYGTLNLQDAAKIHPRFEARYPGVKVEHVRAGGEALVQRLVTEARGGRVLADVLETVDQEASNAVVAGLVEPFAAPEGAGYPPEYRDPNNMWFTTRVRTEVIAFNTSLVRPEEAPRGYDDLADPKWKGRLMMDGSSITQFATLRKQKFGNDLARTREFFEKVAANQPEMHEGAREITQLLAAGQNAVFTGAAGQDIEELKKGGAPVDWSKNEGILELVLGMVVKGAPHPNAARLYLNWVLSEDYQQFLVEMGRLPSRPGVTPPAGLMPPGVRWYHSSPETARDYETNLRAFNAVFGLR